MEVDEPTPSAAAPRRWSDDPRICTVELPNDLRAVGKRQCDGTVGDGWYNINLGEESDPGTAYDELEPVVRHQAFLVEVMQNVIDWCTLEVSRLHPRARGGIFTYIDDDHGLLGSSCIQKQVRLDIPIGGSADATIARASIDVLTPSGPQPLVEIVVDPSTRAVHMLQLGQSMIVAETLLRIMSGTKDSKNSVKLQPPRVDSDAADGLPDRGEFRSRERNASPLDVLVPQGGRHGLGFKQLMVLLMKNEWGFTMRGSVTAPDEAGELVPAVHSLTPEWSDSKACVVMHGQTHRHQPVVADAAVLRLFRPEVQAIVRQQSKPLLLQTLIAPRGVDGTLLRQQLCFSHLLFRSPLPLSQHVAWSTRDVPQHRLNHTGPLASDTADDYVGFDFQRRYDSWREWSTYQCYRAAPPPLSLNLHDTLGAEVTAPSAAAAPAAAASSSAPAPVAEHEAGALRLARLDPVLDAFQFGRTHVTLAVNGTPVKLLPSDQYGDVLVVTADVQRFTTSTRGKFTDRPEHGFFDCVLRHVNDFAYGVEDEYELTPPLRWYLTLVARFFAQPSTHWAVLLRNESARAYPLGALVARFQCGGFRGYFSSASVKAHERDLEVAGLYIPANRQRTVHDLLGEFFDWLMDDYREDDAVGGDCTPRTITLRMRSVPQFVSRRVLRGVVANEKMRPQPVETYLNELGLRLRSEDAAARDDWSLDWSLDSPGLQRETDRDLFGVLRCFRTLAAFFTREQRWIGGCEGVDLLTGVKTQRLPSGDEIRVWVLDAPARGCHVDNAHLDRDGQTAFLYSPGYRERTRSFKQIRFVMEAKAAQQPTPSHAPPRQPHANAAKRSWEASRGKASAAAAAAASSSTEHGTDVVCPFDGEVDLRHEAFRTPSHNIVVMLEPLRKVLAAQCQPHAVIDHFLAHIKRNLPLQDAVADVLTPLLCWELNQTLSEARDSYKYKTADGQVEFADPFPLKITVHQRMLLAFLRGCSDARTTLDPNLRFSRLFPRAPQPAPSSSSASGGGAAAAAASAPSLASRRPSSRTYARAGGNAAADAAADDDFMADV
jgi:hypothetical protein